MTILTNQFPGAGGSKERKEVKIRNGEYGGVMAYSSQTEHGQNERKARVLSAIANESSKERPKVRFGVIFVVTLSISAITDAVLSQTVLWEYH